MVLVVPFLGVIMQCSPRSRVAALFLTAWFCFALPVGPIREALGDPPPARVPEGPWTPLPGPPMRYHAAIYDPVRDRMVVLSGRDFGNRVWQFSMRGT